MDTTVTVEKPTRNEWMKSTKKTFTIWPVLKDEDKGRCVTEKNWRVVFVIIFIYWLYAIYEHTYSDVLPDHSTTTNNTSHLVFNEADYDIIDNNNEVAKDTFEISHHEAYNKTTSDTDTKKIRWDVVVELLLIIAEAYTCNLSNLEEYDEKLKIRRIVGIYLLASFNILLLAISFVQSDKKMFSKQPSVFGAVILFIALIERLSVIYNMSNSVASSWMPSHEKLIYWVLPETVILIIWLSKMFSAVHYKDSDDFCDVKSILRNDENDGNDSAIGSDDESVDEIAESSSDDEAVDVSSSTDSDNGSDNESVEDVADEGPNDRPVDEATENNGSNNNSEKSPKDELAKIKYVYKIIPFHYYTYAFVFSFPFVIILKLLMTFTISVLHNADWQRSYTYIIVGGSIYVGLTIYYFGLMLTACATNMLIDSEKFTLNDLHRAVYIVTRYHFGSACYRAMPMGPSSEAFRVMEESELKTLDRLSPVCYAFHKYDTKLSRTIIGARGYDHADSVREVIRVVTTVPMQDYFYSFGSMTGFLLKLLLPINSLMIIFLRDRGVYDPHFAKASWVMYLTMTFTFYLVMPFFKTVSDTIGLRLCEKQVNKRERFGEV